MTHARQKGSLGGAAERRDSRHLWTQGGAMGDAAPERSLRFGRTKKIAEVIRKRKVAAKRAGGKKGRTERSDQNRKLDRRRDHKPRDRKSYPLRGRPAGSEEEEEEEEGLSCHVLLTRLEESVREREGSGERAPVRPRPKKLTSIKRKAAKSSPKTGPESSSRGGAECLGVPPPRKRRLASLNAEAVNSLLLERATETQAAAKQARRPPNAGTSLHANPGGPADAKAARRNAGKTPASRGHGRRQSSERAQKAEANRAAAAVSQESLDAPAPRRLAGLNAAALLKLTSSSATSKQRVKNAPAATVASKRPTRVRRKGRPQGQRGGEAAPPRGGGCAACETEADFQPAAGWDTRRLTKPGYQSRGVLAYPLKQVKEEPLETDLSPYYCCPPEGSVEYCHRLAFFLGQRPCGGASAAAAPPPPPLPSAAAPVKRECLVTSPHAALTLSPHPCLCTAEHCFSSYYVHIAHPARAGTTSAGLASRPLNFAPAGLCPDRVAGPKLLGPHPACCYGEACGMGGYACRAMAPVASRGCSFSAGCAGCTRGIKTEGYSSPQGDHSPSLLPLPALPLSSCPLSAAPSSTQTRPHLLTPLSGRDRPQARLKLASECPRGNGPAAGSLSVGRAGLTHKQQQQQQPPPPPPPSLGAAKQRRVGRRRATNGWRPVGTATEREVFIAGEDETAPRQCYEGVERDGEVIHIRDTVLLRSGPRKKSLPYVAKISALWEDPKTGELMMSLFWYYRPEHTQGGRDPSAHCENEIFASRHQDENSVACIEDRCYVLPLAQYCRFCALVRRRAEGAPPGSASVVPCRPDFAPPLHRCVPTDVDPELVYLCRHVYDFRFGRILKNLQ